MYFLYRGTTELTFETRARARLSSVLAPYRSQGTASVLGDGGGGGGGEGKNPLAARDAAAGALSPSSEVRRHYTKHSIQASIQATVGSSIPPQRLAQR